MQGFPPWWRPRAVGKDGRNMIRTSPATIHRAAAIILAAAVLPFLTPHTAYAQQVVDLFGGAIGTPTQLSVSTPGLPAAPSTATTGGTFGPGYTGSLTLGLSTGTTLSESFSNPGTGNALSFTLTGTAAGGINATAAKTFGAILSPNTTYAFTLTRANAAAVNLLGTFGVSMSNSISGAFLNTTSGQGLAGIVDVLGLFGTTGTTSTFTFTTPATYNPTGNLTVTFTENVLANAASGNITLNGASINQVPEPGTVAAMLLGAGGLVALRFRRRLAVV